jgi:hypothetical protein
VGPVACAQQQGEVQPVDVLLEVVVVEVLLLLPEKS